MAQALDDLIAALQQARRDGCRCVADVGSATAGAWASVALAQLMKEGWLQWVLLDRYQEDWLNSCVLADTVPTIYDLAAGAVPPANAGRALLFRHGQREATTEPHDAAALRRWQELTEPALAIVFGSVDDEKPFSAATLGGGQTRLWRIGGDAASTLLALARRLGCFPPDWLRDPLRGLRQSIAALPPVSWVDGAAPLAPGQPLDRLLADADAVLRGDEAIGGADERRRLWRQHGVHVNLLAGNYAAAAGTLTDMVAEEGDAGPAWRLLATCLLEQARSLCAQAVRAELKQANRHFARAGDLFARVLELQPDHFEAYRGWGQALQAQAKRDPSAAAHCYRASGEKYRAALALREDAEAWYEWGSVLQALAMAVTGEEAEPLFEEAEEKFVQAVKLKPRYHQAWWQWGEALRGRAMKLHGEAAKEHHRQAEEKFAQAALLNQNDAGMFNRWGLLLLEQANRSMGEERRMLLERAAVRFGQAEELQPGIASYDLACLASLRGDEEQARHWLLKCNAAGTLPPSAHILADPDLELLRNAAWFVDLFPETH